MFDEWEKHFLRLTEHQRGALIMALFAYHKRGGEPDDGDPAVGMAFSFMQAALDENQRKYEKVRTARAEAGRAGGLAKASKNDAAAICQPKRGKAALSESGSESGSGSGSASNSDTHLEGRVVRFTPPTVEEVAAYVAQRGSAVDPQGFVDFYAAKGWLMGKTMMGDWKAACRNADHWERWTRRAPEPLSTEADKRVREDRDRMIRFMRENREKEQGIT